MAAAARERVEHLWRAAHTTCAQQPALSQHLLSSMRATAQEANVRLSDSITQRYCACCSSLLMPGVNCTVRLSKRRRAHERGNQDCDAGNDDSKAETGNVSKVRTVVAPTKGAGRKGQQLSARTWWDAQTQQRKPSKNKSINQLVYRCSHCGTSVLSVGSESSAARERTKKRAGDRRSERFRDAEKAEAAHRVENMKSFVQKQKLSSGAIDGGEVPSAGSRRSFLPDTMSPKAQAALDSSFRVKA
eukprot:CAMPEP_0179414122 /NCGR_PEP_ID=MMETSP0799-20121207/5485_1 /TAXON_ID=46947 /ORGANISM="Geminigera cryophila, Strain CCMP2564" /LENGTH=244 /DNA_ID=CAMNT_0021186683 /DNA_START=335 /DNA_END=1065 /DNA_ORIENTATION=-